MSQITNQASYEAAKVRLREAASGYYADGTSAMTDAQYDELLAAAAAYEESHGIVEDVVGEAVAAGAGVDELLATDAMPVRHSSKMLSLDNLYDVASLRAWVMSLVERLGHLPSMVVEPKLDGMAMSVRYEDGRPVQMLTRGDGTTGEDVTAAMPLVDLPEGPADFSGEVRGEVVFSREQFEAANDARVAAGRPAFANPRNAGAGTVNRAARSGADSVPAGTRLSFLAYGLADAESYGFDTHSAAMAHLSSLDFRTALSLLPPGAGALDPEKPETDFDCDGLVYKVDPVADQVALGSSSRAPRWARAYKFPPEVGRTRLVGVEWAVGRTGSVTPRAVLEPVRVGGVTITSATLNNPGDIARKGVMIGDVVEVRRAAEVIPEITGVVDPEKRTGDERPISTPKTCPECGEGLLSDQARLRCPSGGECAVERWIEYATSRDALDVEGLSTSLVEALVTQRHVIMPADLFAEAMTAELIASTPTGRLRKDGTPVLVGDATAKKIKAEIERVRREATFDRVLISLGLKGTGRSMSRRLAQHFGSMDALMAASPSQIELVDKMGPVKAGSVYDQLRTDRMRANVSLLREAGLAMEVEQADPSKPQPLAGMSVVVTGFRGELLERIEAAGATVSSSVSAKTSVVVAKDPDGTSSKLKKARDLGIEVCDPETFEKKYLG